MSYQENIIKACKLSGDSAEKESEMIEEVMRCQHPTLDGLDARTFNQLARLSKEALKDPELRALYEVSNG